MTKLCNAAILVFLMCIVARPCAAQMGHAHAGHEKECAEAAITCAPRVTATFITDGSLLAIWEAQRQVWVARSSDLGRTFSAKVAVTPGPVALDTGPDARPKIVATAKGDIVATYTVFRDTRFTGEIFYARSFDGGASFSRPESITEVQEGQRFEAMAVDQDGRIFAAWLDKRNRGPAAAKGEKYIGTALAYTWLDDKELRRGETGIALDNTCECCRLGIDFAGPGRPVVAFRNVFDKTTRDHAVITFEAPTKPGPARRVSIDNWKTDACPHQGPSLAIGSAGTYHVVWYTAGIDRKGVFYARSDDAGETFSNPMPLTGSVAASRPFVHASGQSVRMVWKEFNGDVATINARASSDDGKTWSPPRVVATTKGDSDHPLLIARGSTVYLSWQTEQEGYRLIELGVQG